MNHLRLLIMLLALATLSARAQCVAEWYHTTLPKVETASGMPDAVAFPDGCGEFVMEGKIALDGNRNGHALDGKGWTLCLKGADGAALKTIELTYHTRGGAAYLEEQRVACCRIYDATDSAHAECETVIKDERDIYGRLNAIVLEAVGGTLRVWLGGEEGRFIGETNIGAPVTAFSINGSRDMAVTDMHLKWRRSPGDVLRSGWTENAVLTLLDTPEESRPAAMGVWEFLDRDTESEMAEPGGRYRLAVMPHRKEFVSELPAAAGSLQGVEPDYDIVYLSGALSNGNRWEPGMLKGHLYSTSFTDHYRMVWYDAYFESMGEEVTADITPDGAILSANFPLYRSGMRFARVKK